MLMRNSGETLDKTASTVPFSAFRYATEGPLLRRQVMGPLGRAGVHAHRLDPGAPAAPAPPGA